MGKGQLSAVSIVPMLLLSIPSNSIAQPFPLDSIKGLKLRNVAAEAVTFSGRKAVRLTEPSGNAITNDADRMAIVSQIETLIREQTNPQSFVPAFGGIIQSAAKKRSRLAVSAGVLGIVALIGVGLGTALKECCGSDED